MFYSGPFDDFFKNEQQRLSQALISFGIDKNIISDIISSGYYLDDEDMVIDSYYRNEILNVGCFSLNYFVDILRNGKSEFSYNVETHVVKDVQEIYDFLNSDDYSRYLVDNQCLSFRGQNKEYFTKRLFPNPSLRLDDGSERMIIPNVYRKYSTDFQKRILDDDSSRIFRTIYGDDLIFYGYDLQSLSKSNHEKYGIHGMGDLIDFPEPINHEVYDRWLLKMHSIGLPDIAIVSQHYGLDTSGLDLSFDPAVSAFFATNSFVTKPNGKSDFQAISNGNHQGVIYCFCFRAPQIRKTRDLIVDVPGFKNIFPLRPLRQSCALPFFLSHHFNEANQYLYKIFQIHQDFDLSTLPSKDFLFPNIEEDAFYKAALDVKRKRPKIWSGIIEYDFT